MRELYEMIRERPRLNRQYGQQVHYRGIGEHVTVYNATPPLWLNVDGRIRRVSVGRVEHPNDWAHSRIMFFERQTDTEYQLLPEAPVFYGEDPSVTTINGEIVLTSVCVSAIRRDKYLLETQIRRATDVMDLWECWRSIPGKDNRLTSVDDGSCIAVMTRPQGNEAGRGRMAYLELASIQDLCADRLRDAVFIIVPYINERSWVGANELHDLSKKSQIGILAHGAFEDESVTSQGKTYFIFFAWLDRKTLCVVDIEPLAIREDFPASFAKVPALSNVAFGTGLVVPMEEPRRSPELYAGIGDLSQAYMLIDNPKILGLYE